MKTETPDSKTETENIMRYASMKTYTAKKKHFNVNLPSNVIPGCYNASFYCVKFLPQQIRVLHTEFRSIKM